MGCISQYGDAQHLYRCWILMLELDSLPTTFDTLMFWSVEDLEELKGTTVVGMFWSCLLTSQVQTSFFSTHRQNWQRRD